MKHLLIAMAVFVVGGMSAFAYEQDCSALEAQVEQIQQEYVDCQNSDDFYSGKISCNDLRFKLILAEKNLDQCYDQNDN